MFPIFMPNGYFCHTDTQFRQKQFLMLISWEQTVPLAAFCEGAGKN